MRRMDEEAVALYNHGLSTLGFVALIFVEGNFPAALQAFQRPDPLAGVIVLGLIAAASLPFYYAALRRMAVWKVRAWMLATPVVVAAIEWPLWGNRLSTTQLLGAALVIAGLGALIGMESRARMSNSERR